MDAPRQALVFHIGMKRYAVDILDLKEVSRMPQLAHTVTDNSVDLGLIQLHGRPVRVYDLGQFLGQPPEAQEGPSCARHWLIVCRTDADAVHWRVDDVEDIVEYSEAQVTVQDAATSHGPESVFDVLELDQQLIYLLRPDRVDEQAMRGIGEPA